MRPGHRHARRPPRRRAFPRKASRSPRRPCSRTISTGHRRGADASIDVVDADAAPLGAARAQLHDTYIVAQTRDGIVLVDQHAAHERLVYERLKADRATQGIARQALLIPVVVEMDARDVERLAEAAPLLDGLGLAVEPFGPGAVLGARDAGRARRRRRGPPHARPRRRAGRRRRRHAAAGAPARPLPRDVCLPPFRARRGVASQPKR